MRYPSYIENGFDFPDFFRVQMTFPGRRIMDVKGETARQFDKIKGAIRPGQTVAIGVGSRGIGQLNLMVAAICEGVLGMGGHPVIIPAMGSHGGAVPQGQENILKAMNITEAECGAPVDPVMDVQRIGTVFGDVPVFFSRSAMRADHIVCVNRIKLHSKFKAPLESGMAKMLCVGMGKHDGAVEYHRGAIKHGFYPLLKEMGEAIVCRVPFLGGVGVVENGYDQAMIIEAIPPESLFQREAELLAIARRHFPRLPFSKLDVLVVEQAGKEISGAGMDPNVTGRAFDLMESDFSERMTAIRLAILDLTDQTAGNGIGVGNADIITEKVFEKIDYEKTLINALTSLSLRKAFIPVRMPTERKAIQACFATLGPVPPESVRAAIIKDTSHLSEFLASAALFKEIEKWPHAEILDRGTLEFDGEGNLTGRLDRPDRGE